MDHRLVRSACRGKGDENQQGKQFFDELQGHDNILPLLESTIL
jgi:hypothetical protein